MERMWPQADAILIPEGRNINLFLMISSKPKVGPSKDIQTPTLKNIDPVKGMHPVWH